MTQEEFGEYEYFLEETQLGGSPTNPPFIGTPMPNHSPTQDTTVFVTSTQADTQDTFEEDSQEVPQGNAEESDHHLPTPGNFLSFI